MSGLVILSLIIDSSCHHISIINMKRRYISTYSYYKSFLREIDNIESRYRKDKKFMNALKLGLLLIFFGLVAIPMKKVDHPKNMGYMHPLQLVPIIVPPTDTLNIITFSCWFDQSDIR